MINTLAIANYRSIRDLTVELGAMTVITGANGTGKSNLYRGLKLLCSVAAGDAISALAREGGLESALWAGPESVSRAMRQGHVPIEGGPRRKPVSLRLGFATDTFGYAIDFGLPTPAGQSLFGRDPEIKREVIWHGTTWHPQRALIERRGGQVRGRDDAGKWRVVEQHLATFDSMLARCTNGQSMPEALTLREDLRAWRFYDHFRCDAGAPARAAHIGVRTPILANDGADLPAAWQTILEIGDGNTVNAAVSDAFPGATVDIHVAAGRFELHFRQPGVLRPLTQAELSDGTLRYLLLVAALATPRPPPLMVLNEPETSLHPDLLPALGRLMRNYAKEHQLWVVSHAPALTNLLGQQPDVVHIQLDKQFSETHIVGQDTLTRPAWKWPNR